MNKESYIQVAQRRESRAVRASYIPEPLAFEGTGCYAAAHYEIAGDARLKAKQPIRALRNYEKAFNTLSNPAYGYRYFEDTRQRLNCKILKVGEQLRETWLSLFFSFN